MVTGERGGGEGHSLFCSFSNQAGLRLNVNSLNSVSFKFHERGYLNAALKTETHTE